MAFTHVDKLSAVNAIALGAKGAEVTVMSPDRYLYLAKGNIVYNGGATQTIATVPANSLVLEVILNITTAFAGTGVTIDIGDASDADRFIANVDVTEGAIGFTRSTLTAAAGAKGHLYTQETSIVASLGGTPTAGAATVYVLYAKVG